MNTCHQNCATLHFVLSIPKEELDDRNIQLMKAIADQMTISLLAAETHEELKKAYSELQELDEAKIELQKLGNSSQ